MEYKNLINKIKVLIFTLIGFGYKLLIDILPIKFIPSLEKNNKNPKFIVSLTSYGRRVKSIVYYTLVSILFQTHKPDKIILWLDSDNWNENNLPKKLSQLNKKGVDIKFCPDFKSYKKLLPTLTDFPDSIIITVDDDIIYKRNLIYNLYKAHLENPNLIIANEVRYPKINLDGSFTDYNQWYTTNNKQNFLMPIGEGGILYPPGSLNKEVLDYSKAKELSPDADDLWFWIMAKLKKSNHKKNPYQRNIGYSFDILYQYLHKNSALTHTNRKEGKNDIQLKSLMDYYKLKNKDLYNF